MAPPRLSPEPPGLGARRAALRLLDAVLRRGQALESALDRATADLTRREDRGLAHAIAAESLRRLPDLDRLIDSATRQRLPDDAKARFALRIALVQALALGTPPHAAIATVLPLVDGGPRKLVHGVFGTLLRGGAALPPVPTLPDDVAERWTRAWGGEVAAAAARAIASPPPIDLALRGEESTVEGHPLLRGHRRVAADAQVTQLPGFEDGEWWVQDLAASLPARLIGAGRGTALDLCAAPGGKTLQLAAMGWQVTAVDISESRLGRLRDNLARTRLDAAVVAADALRWTPRAPVDAMLLDAPCSATGIFRRHPDVLHRVTPALIAETTALQAQLLTRAADWVVPGGALVFATCSLEPEEGEAQIDAFLAARPDYRLSPADGAVLPVGVPVAPEGWVRTLPGMLEGEGGCDGFFMARLVRTA